MSIKCVDSLMQFMVFTQIVFRITADTQSSLVLTTEENWMLNMFSFWAIVTDQEGCSSYCVKKQTNTKGKKFGLYGKP